MTYQDTSCGGGKKLDQVFELCGARRLGERLEVDAPSQPLPDEEALAWIEGWENLVRSSELRQGEDLDRLGDAAQVMFAERLQRHGADGVELGRGQTGTRAPWSGSPAATRG